MTAINHVCPEPLVLTTADRRDMQQSLAHDVRVITELAERIGRDDLGSSDLIDAETGSASSEDELDCDRLDPIADRVLRRRLVRAVLRHTHRAARLAELLLELSDEPGARRVKHDRVVASAPTGSSRLRRRG
jgi:hypothetical protein